MRSNGAPEEDLLKLSLLLGLGWVETNLDQFQIAKAVAGPFDKSDVARLKPISELAMTLELIHRCGIRIAALDKLAAWVWCEVDHGRTLTTLLLARNDFLPCCALYSSLHQMGYRAKSLHAAVRTLAGSDMAAVLPLQPWSRLAMHYNLSKVGLATGSFRDCGTLYLERRPEPWIMSSEIAYAVTHEVFYLTDFGFRVIPDMCVGEYLRLWLPYWASIFSEEQNDDILGEFAMCWACLADWSECQRNSPLGLVLAHQSSDGSVQGPRGAGGFLYTEADSPARRQFLSSYHTTLVCIMACAMTLRRMAEAEREASCTS